MPVEPERPHDDGDAPAFLWGGGVVGALARSHDWSATAFGPIETWPQSLRSMVSACLNSPMLGAVLWGPDLLMIYNDAYIPSRHSSRSPSTPAPTSGRCATWSAR